MHRMRRAAGVPALVLILAACAAPGTGAGGTPDQGEPSSSMTLTGSSPPSSSVMASPQGEATGDDRVDLSVLTADPGSFEGQPLTILAKVDEVLVDGTAFLTSPSGTEEGRIAVIVRPDGQIDKEPTAGAVVWVDGTVAGFSAEDLQAAGIDISPGDLGGFDGEFAVIADAVRDPLASDAGT